MEISSTPLGVPIVIVILILVGLGLVELISRPTAPTFIILILIGMGYSLAGWWPYAQYLFYGGVMLLVIVGFIRLFCWMRRQVRSRFLCVVFLLFLVTGTAAAAGEIVQMPKRGSLWQMAQDCGQPASAWPAIAAANPWLKVKMVKGQPMAQVQSGQPIILPEGWVIIGNEEAEDSHNNFSTALWRDFCDMVRDYPVPTILLVFIIIAAITARSTMDARRKFRREAESVAELETTHSSRHQRGQWESVFLPR